MEAKFSPKVKEVISYSREEALRLGHDYIGIEHLLLGLIREGEGLAVKTMRSLQIDLILFRKQIEDSIKEKSSKTVYNPNSLPLTKQAEKVLKITVLEAKVMRSDVIGTEHLMLSILKSKDNIVSQLLAQHDVDYDVFKAELDVVQNQIKAELPNESDDDSYEDERNKGSFGNAGAKKGGASKSKTPVLDNFGRDVTAAAEEGTLDPIVGREAEIERVSQILSRRKKK